MLVQVFASAVEDANATYVSSPLTTGFRAFDWHRENVGRVPGNGAFATEVIEPNRKDAALFVRKLRATRRNAVIDPTAMPDLDGWEQADYRYFWGRIIEEYCCEIVFRDGWQFSSGCSYEFLVALGRGLATKTERLEPLALSQALNLLDRAVTETEASGASAAFLVAVRDALR